MPAFRRQQIQYACQPLLIALGYDEPDTSEEEEEGGPWEGEDGGLEPSAQEPGLGSDAAAAALFDGSAENEESGDRYGNGGGGGGGESRGSMAALDAAGDGRGKGWRASSSLSSSPIVSDVEPGKTKGSAATAAAAAAAAEVIPAKAQNPSDVEPADAERGETFALQVRE